eukprot:6490475-Amphidinium_carterae.2
MQCTGIGTFCHLLGHCSESSITHTLPFSDRGELSTLAARVLEVAPERDCAARGRLVNAVAAATGVCCVGRA